MKFAIMGAGAMGCLVGGLLAKNNEDVILIDVWKEHVDAINKNGLFMEEVGKKKENIKIKATCDVNTVGVVDVIIFLVKGTVTESAIKQCKPMIDKNTMVITLQNGLGNSEKISSVVDKTQVAYGVMEFSAVMKGPGVITYELAKGNVFMGLEDEKEKNKLKDISLVFQKAGINAVVSDDAEERVWKKLVINSGFNPICAITALSIGSLMKEQEYIKLLEQVTSEVVTVANKKGIKLNYDDEIENLKSLGEMVKEHYPSMAQDVAHKKLTEIDFINGAVVREGNKLGVETPVNTTLVRLVKIIENTYENNKIIL